MATFDPTLLENGTYQVRVTYLGLNGESLYIDDEVSVEGELKLGNFRLSFTDLAVPVTGIPITLTRTYDTLTAHQSDDFGFGWRMEFRDTDLRTSLLQPSEEEQLLGRFPAFKDGTKVFITLPGGKREAFTFRAKRVESFKDGNQQLSTGMFANYFYEATFQSQAGSIHTLAIESPFFTKDANGRYVGFQQQPFNPADPLFGGVYVLTSKDGTQYRIDARTGDLLRVKDTNGNTLTYTDDAITSSTGQKVTFERDAQGRIVAVKDPMQELIRYQYDNNGDLVGVTDQEGNVTRFVYDATDADRDGKVDRPHFLKDIIDPLGRTGARSVYDDAGRLKQVIDVNGKAVEMTYDMDRDRQIVKDALGNQTTYIYDDRGNVLTEIDAEGGVITRTYDDNNNLLTQKDADGVIDIYTYDDNNNLTSVTDGQGNVTRITYGAFNKVTNVISPTGLTVQSEFDSRGNLTRYTDTDGLVTQFEYDSSGRLNRQTAPDGQVTQWEYDHFGNPSKMVDSRGNELTSQFDRNGQVQNATMPFVVNGQMYNLSTTYTYDKEGRVINSTNSKGNSQSATYNPLGQMVSQVDALGNTTLYEYDARGNINRIVLSDNTPDNATDNPTVRMEYDDAGQLISRTAPTGLVTRYVYDRRGLLLEEIIPDLTPENSEDNPRIKMEYTAAGRLKARVDEYGNREEFQYNSLGQVTEYKDPLGNVTTYTYGQGGKLLSSTDPRNRTTRYIYDDQARLKEVLYFDGTRSSIAYDALSRIQAETNELGQTVRYEYDAYSQVKAVINPLNQRTEFEYDGRRNLIRVTDARQHTTRYTYDEYSRQTDVLFHNGDRTSRTYDRFDRTTSFTDENRNTTRYDYDNLSQLTHITQPNQAVTRYGYDNLGRLTQVSDANHNVTRYEYDAFDRVTATVLPMGQRSTTVYDRLGQVQSRTDFNGDTIQYAYDRYGRLAGKTFTDSRVAPVTYTYDAVSSQLKTVTDGRGTTRYNYDSRDRLIETIQPDSQFVRYSYDVLSNVTSLTTNAGTTAYSYDMLNRLDTVKDGHRLLADYDYDAVGNHVQTKFANGSVETRAYDSRDRLTQITTKNVVGTVFSGFTYTLDAAGNRTKVVEHTGRTVDYQYDALHRLTQEAITDPIDGNRSIGYSYDLVGNRLTKTDSLQGQTTYSYDRNNRLTQTALGNQVAQFRYNNNGSLVQRSDGTSTIDYDWFNDGENRLAAVKLTQNGTVAQTQFLYDAFGERVATIHEGVRTNYLSAPIWDLPEVLMEYDAAGQVTADYTHGRGLVRSRQNNREAFYHTDGLGSTRALTDVVGLVTDRYTYDAYGSLLKQEGTFGNSFGFAGEQRDGETGLDYLRARYYDSSVGRFISKDAFAGTIADPMSQHDYQYAHANPTRYTDPTGYFSLGEALTTLSLMTTMAGVYGGLGVVGYKYVTTGLTEQDVYGLYGDWFAGYADGVSGGLSSDIRSLTTGEPVTPGNQGWMWRMGQVAGIGTMMAVGMKSPQWATGQMGSLKLIALLEMGSQAYGFGKAIGHFGMGLQDGWGQEDTWNLVPLLLGGISVAGIGKSLAAAKATSRATSSTGNAVDDAVRSASKSATTVGGKCFVAGTEILTTDGEKSIEDIQVGDWVIADDPTTPGEIEARQVLETFVRHTDKLVDLYIDGEVISTTGEHPFWTPDKGWVEAKDLEVGSLLQTEDGRIIDVDKIERRQGDFTVYNFKVEGFHTYFVSDLSILVHNANYDSQRVPIPQRLQEYFRRLGEASNARSAEEGLQQVRNLLNQVEDDLSGIPMQDPPPPPDMPDGRMYPPLDDYTIRHPDGSITARSRGHRVDIGADGSITITNRKTGQVEISKPGAGQ